ncbi:unnamed protein product [Cuscuta campestris]|uniref:Uncharacterized protein n=1 Tax=Cuscuta campestris TaxID=132261 RepID=A0A484KFI7_9ASTE|nr:unnamed protein product [Cuscuta campestris]VFQ64598.1 unnamed protein product [Cuscuta campestris]
MVQTTYWFSTYLFRTLEVRQCVVLHRESHVICHCHIGGLHGGTPPLGAVNYSRETSRGHNYDNNVDIGEVMHRR